MTYSSSSPAATSSSYSLARGPVLHLQSLQHCISSSIVMSFSAHSWERVSDFKDPRDDTGPPDNPGSSPPHKVLNSIPSSQSLLPCQVTYAQVPGIRARTSWGKGWTVFC